MMAVFRADCKQFQLHRGSEAESAIDFLLFFSQTGNGYVVVVARGFGDLTHDVAAAMFQMAATQRADGSVEKLCGERFVILHQDGHEQRTIFIRDGQRHEICAIGERLENGINERLGAQTLMQLL
jgi:hypothetical protein